MDNYTLANSSVQEDINIESEISDRIRYVLIILMTLIALTGIPGNGLVITVQTKLRKKTSTDYLVFTMAAFDLFSAAINSTCYILRFQKDIWMVLATVEFCQLHMFSLYTTNVGSTLLLTAIAFDRYRRTIARLPADSPYVAIKTKRICAGIVVFSFGVGAFAPFITTLESATKICSRSQRYAIIRNILKGVLAVTFAAMFTVVVYCYTKMSFVLRRHRKVMSEMQLKSHKIEKRCGNKERGKTSNVQPLSDKDYMPSTSKDFPIRLNTSKGHLYNSFRPDIAPTKELFVYFSKGSKEIDLKVPNKCDADEKKFKVNQSDKSDGNGVVSQNANPDARPNKSSSDMSQQKRALNTNEQRRRQRMNRMNLMMFLITLVYFGTWMGNWISVAYEYIVGAPLPAAQVARTLFMINAMTNPIFYMIMSSKFREKTKELLC